MSNMER